MPGLVTLEKNLVTLEKKPEVGSPVQYAWKRTGHFVVHMNVFFHKVSSACSTCACLLEKKFQHVNAHVEKIFRASFSGPKNFFQ